MLSWGGDGRQTSDLRDTAATADVEQIVTVLDHDRLDRANCLRRGQTVTRHASGRDP
jgi:hypothetical protein